VPGQNQPWYKKSPVRTGPTSPSSYRPHESPNRCAGEFFRGSLKQSDAFWSERLAARGEPPAILFLSAETEDWESFLRWFAGFAAFTLANRIDDDGATVVITSNAGKRKGDLKTMTNHVLVLNYFRNVS
jgi:hypothetical protein